MKHKIFTQIPKLFREGSSPRRRSEKDADSVNNTSNTEEFEHCVLCGKLTCVPISMPVDWREDYEIGVGQLCIECKRILREATEK